MPAATDGLKSWVTWGTSQGGWLGEYGSAESEGGSGKGDETGGGQGGGERGAVSAWTTERLVKTTQRHWLLPTHFERSEYRAADDCIALFDAVAIEATLIWTRPGNP